MDSRCSCSNCGRSCEGTCAGCCLEGEAVLHEYYAKKMLAALSLPPEQLRETIIQMAEAAVSKTSKTEAEHLEWLRLDGFGEEEA